MSGVGQARQNQQFSAVPGLQVTALVATQTLPSCPVGVYTLAKTVAGVITITLPAPIAGVDDGKVSIFVNSQTQVNIISSTGNFLAVGVAKGTITFTAGLVGEFVRLMAVGGAYVVMDIVTTGGGTLS